jgi:hypothetical protein
MKSVKFILVLGLTLLQTGCEPSSSSADGASSPAESLNPLFAGNGTVCDAALQGEWQMDDLMAVKFQEGGNNACQMTIEGDQTVYAAHLSSLQGHRLLDVAPTQWPGQAADLDMHLDWAQVGVELAPQFKRLSDSIYVEITRGSLDNAGAAFQLRIRPAHWFFRIANDGRTLQLIPLNKEWLDRVVKQGTVSIDHVLVNDEVVLTAGTTDLQKLVADHLSDPEAFTGEMAFKRRN